MALVDQIHELAARSATDLNAIHNFVEHSTLVWRTFRLWVEQGNEFEAMNVETGSKVSAQDLLSLSDHYKNEYLLTLTFQHHVTSFEAFIFDFLRLVLTDEPRHLSQKRQIDVGTALSASDRSALVQILVDKELNDLKYEKVTEWCEYMNRMISLRCPSEIEIGQIAEIKASRDILVHNSGIANQIYMDKAGSYARHRLGGKIDIPGPYHTESWRIIKKVINDITSAAIARL